jgi:hypothetical protein
LLVAALALVVLPAAYAGSVHAASKKSPTTAQLAAKLKVGALATFEVTGERFRVWVTNPRTIQQLKDLRAGTSTASIPNGRILSGPGRASYNAPWRWHLDPQDIQMADMTTEVCDGRPSYVNQHLHDFVGTVKRYCPWAAKLVGLRVMSSGSADAASPSELRVVSTTNDGTSAQHTVVSLQWKDNAKGETGYRIHAAFTRLYGGSDSQSQDVPANTTKAEFKFVGGGINPVSRACFTVTTLYRGGESAPSNEVCVSG